MPLAKTIRTRKRALPRKPPNPQEIALELRPLALLAELVRQRRQEYGWSHHDAAAWCGVGTRFLIDLEMGDTMLRLEKVFQVAHRFGIRFQPCSLVDGPEQPGAFAQFTLYAPQECRYPQEWLALHYAGLRIARALGIEAAVSRPVRNECGLEALQIISPVLPEGCRTLAACLRAPHRPSSFSIVTSDRSLHVNASSIDFADATAFFTERSVLPVRDIEQLTRWMVMSNAIADTEGHLDRWLVRPLGGGLRLAPLATVLCGSKFFGPDAHQGDRVGNSSRDGGLRVRDWATLASSAGVHNKVVFHYMWVSALRAPGELDRALLDVYGAGKIPSFIMDVVRQVRASCYRLGEVVKLAERELPGLKSRPKVEKLLTSL